MMLRRFGILFLLTIMLLFLIFTHGMIWAASPAPQVEFDVLSGKLTHLSTLMEFCIGAEPSTTAWQRVPYNGGMVATFGETWHFRYRAQAGREASDIQTVYIPTASSKPDPESITYVAGKIVGLSPALEYNKVSATHGVWTLCSGEDLAVALTTTPQYYYFRTAALTLPASEAIEVVVPAAARSDTSKIILDYAYEVFRGFGSDGGGWQYACQGSDYVGRSMIDITSDTIEALPGRTYYFRQKGDSLSTAITTPPRPAPPTGITYDALNNLVRGVTGSMEYRLDGDVATQIVGTTLAFNQGDVWFTLEIAYGPSATAFRSQYAILRVWPRSKISPYLSALHHENGVIYGVSLSMEYQIDATDGEWTSCNGETLLVEPVDKDQIVYIRLKDFVNGPTLPEKVTVPSRLAAPKLTLDLETGKIIGFDPEMEYVFKGSGWKPLTVPYLSADKREMSLESFYKSAGVTLQFARKPTYGAPEAANITSITLPAAPAKPTVPIKSISDAAAPRSQAVVQGRAGMQFRPDGDPNWGAAALDDSDITLPAGYTAATYRFRMAASASSQPSAETTVKIAAPPKLPALKPDYKKELLVVKAGLSYCLDGANWIDVAKGSKAELPLENLYGSMVWVRTTPQLNKPASQIQVLYVNPRIPDVPTSGEIFIAEVSGKLKVTVRSGARPLEYKDSTGKWKKGIPAYSDTLNTEIRYAADTLNGPSRSVTLTKDGV